MRVLIAHNRYRVAGGEERHVALLASALKTAGLETRLFERESDTLAASRLHRLRAGALLAYSPRGGGIGKVLEDWRPDVVHFHNIWPHLTPAALRLAKRADAAVVLTLHNCRFACPGGTCSVQAHPAHSGLYDNQCLAGSSLRCALRHNPRGDLGESVAYGLAQEIQRRLHMLERWVDAFVAPSRYVAHMLGLAGIPSHRVTVIPHGVPVGPPVDRREARFALFAGRISAEKGIKTLIEAVAASPDVPVAVAGSGAMVEEVRAAPLAYLGHLDRSGMDRALAEAAFTVIPSECHESFPYGALESFAAGKPVIATAVGGLPEIVLHEETGLIVTPGSKGALADAMRTLWRDPELTAALGAKALQMAREKFTLDLQIERTVELYRELCPPQAASGQRSHAPRSRSQLSRKELTPANRGAPGGASR
jgi:glycosyltransferase involved in cell wall biosynthesis